MTTFQLLDDKWYQSRYLNIRDLGRLSGKKTRWYEVRLRRHGVFVGVIQWVRTGYRIQYGVSFESAVQREAEDFCWYLNSKVRKAAKSPNPKRVRLNRIQALLKQPDGGGLDKRYAPVV